MNDDSYWSDNHNRNVECSDDDDFDDGNSDDDPIQGLDRIV